MKLTELSGALDALTTKVNGIADAIKNADVPPAAEASLTNLTTAVQAAADAIVPTAPPTATTG